MNINILYFILRRLETCHNSNLLLFSCLFSLTPSNVLSLQRRRWSLSHVHEERRTNRVLRPTSFRIKMTGILIDHPSTLTLLLSLKREKKFNYQSFERLHKDINIIKTTLFLMSISTSLELCRNNQNKEERSLRIFLGLSYEKRNENFRYSLV